MNINDLSPEELRILEQFDAEEAAADAAIIEDSPDQNPYEVNTEQWWDFEFPPLDQRCSYDRPRRAGRSCQPNRPA